MVWVKKTNSTTKQLSPSPPTDVQCKRAVPQEPALKDKGKSKIIDVTNVPSSSTSMPFLSRMLATTWVIRPKVDTQEPTLGKTNHLSKKPQYEEAKTIPQEPTPAKEVEPQEPVLTHDGARSNTHYEVDIIKDTKSMLKDLAQSVLAMTSQIKIPPAVTMLASRYATWIFNTLP